MTIKDPITFLLSTPVTAGSITINGHIALGISPKEYFERVSPGKDHSTVNASADRTGTTVCIRLMGEHGFEILSLLSGDKDYATAFQQAALTYQLNKKDPVASVTSKINLTPRLLRVIRSQNAPVSIEWSNNKYGLCVGTATYTDVKLEQLAWVLIGLSGLPAPSDHKQI